MTSWNKGAAEYNTTRQYKSRVPIVTITVRDGQIRDNT